MSAALAWITACAAVAGALIALWRVQVERQRNAVLRDQLKQSERRAEIALLDLHPTGGGGNAVTFTAYVQNLGTRPTRATVSARVGEQPVNVNPSSIDLLVNSPRSAFEVAVPRPQLGDLMREVGHQTTLYGETLVVTVQGDGRGVEGTWADAELDEATNRAQWEVQQRYWRAGLGEETASDLRAAALQDHEAQIERDGT